MYNRYTPEDCDIIAEVYKSEYKAKNPPKPEITTKIYLVRALLSPGIFIYGLFITFIMLVFPITQFLLLSMVFRLISQPFVYLLRIGGSDVKVMDSFIDFHDNVTLDSLVTITIPIWLSFYMVHLYINTGEILDLEGRK